MSYSYQEFDDVLHNFDDRHIFTISLMVFMREYMKVGKCYCTQIMVSFKIGLYKHFNAVYMHRADLLFEILLPRIYQCLL